jgi:predicted small secreted protein
MMRRIALLPLVLASLSVAGCTTTRSDGSPQIQTTSEANRESMQGAASAPLRDLNVLRTKVPGVLLDAMADPYERPLLPRRTSQQAQCDQLAALIKPLDDALGAALDAPSMDVDDLLQKGRTTALGAAASLASDTIPFRGWVRKLSGAEQHDKLVIAAITAGGVRRAYLKGLGEARGCAPPATPSHVLTQVAEAERAEKASRPQPPPQSEGGGPYKPRYPTR